MESMMLCDNPAYLNIMFIFKTTINLLSIIAPIVLIISMMLDIAKAVTRSADEINKVYISMRRKLFAGAIIFFIPTLTYMVFEMFSNSTIDVLCLNQATRENIKIIEDAKHAEEIAKEKSAVGNKNAGSGIGGNTFIYSVYSNNKNFSDSKLHTSTNLNAFINGREYDTLPNDKCMSFSENCSCPNINGLSGFFFTMRDNSGRDFAEVKGGDKKVNVTVKCSNGNVISQTVNEKTKDQFTKAFNRICDLTTIGISGYRLNFKDISFNGTYSYRMISGRIACSKHAYGGAIDINVSKHYTISGISYIPYSGQGSKTFENYKKFVAALGNELDVRNVNYILWKYAFKPSGFRWGGTWDANSFDPMHFEIGG